MRGKSASKQASTFSARRANSVRTFRDEALREIAFPLGGIGTGTISLGGRGNFRDWEIFNHPAKGFDVPWTFFALWAKPQGGRPVAKVLERRPMPPFSAAHGAPRGKLFGLPHLRDCTFRGTYPIARIEFDDDALPLRVALDAFNPMSPLDIETSALPAAVFVWELTNPSRKAVDISLMYSMANPIGVMKDRAWSPGFVEGRLSGDEFGRQKADLRRDRGVGGLLLSCGKLAKDDPRYGTIAVATPFDELTYKCHWRRGAWFDELTWWWDDFADDGRISPRDTEESPAGRTDTCSIGVPLRLAPGQRVRIPFVIAWHFPNNDVPTWRRDPDTNEPINMGNHYATRFADAWEAARHTVANLPDLEQRTRAFTDALYSSTLPPVVLDAAGSQMSIIRSTTCLHFSDGQFAAWEGCHPSSGCCHGSCTHVWNYEQAMAFLYPSLEQSMRVNDFARSTKDDGYMGFRFSLPTYQPDTFKAAADGQLGCVMKLYREWQLSGDDDLLRRLWPAARRALEFAWTSWDRDRDGAMEGEQHNTYDIEFFGYSTMTGTFYLGALLAAAEMADHLGDAASAATYRQLADSGQRKYVQECWNGEYFQQKVIDPDDLGLAPAGGMGGSGTKVDGELKYQYGPGCLSDQLLGQWFAHVVGLGYLLPERHVKKAMGAVFKHNFIDDFSEYANCQRVYALNDEPGLVICTWPRGGRPKLPLVYGFETWTGIAYQVAAHLMYEGRIDDGLRVVQACRDAYAGHNRNPWNEVECGNHYARAMSSWSLLLALSGFHYSAPRQEMSFAPKVNADDFSCFFSTAAAWGRYTQQRRRGRTTATLSVHDGQLALRRFGLAAARGKLAARLVHADVPAALSRRGGRVFAEFTDPLTLTPGAALSVQLG